MKRAAGAPKRIKATADLALALREAERDGTPVELEANGATYHVVTERSGGPKGEPWSGYDAAKVREALAKYAGALAADEADRMVARIYRARAEGARPAHRP